ncbi:MAG: sugar transferase [Deltaproteobacteria bacterium]|nr:sugar transferase [Deltaproteobacteria bacterium]MBI3390251.1 sugar transferase [Deltaproteobacteria bacterium]
MSAVVIVGVGDAAHAVMRAARAANFEVVGDVLAPDSIAMDPPPGVDRVLVAATGISRDRLAQLARRCAERGVSVWLEASALPTISDLLRNESIGGLAGVVFSGARVPGSLTRGLDIVVAAMGLLLLSPALLLIALLVRMSSSGSALHRAEVVGQDGRRFTWYKFRTMRLEGEDEAQRRQRFAEFVDGDNVAGKIVDESRVTAIGRVLRRHSLDELPELFSVLVGDMTLIGPRPCLVYEYELLKRWQRARLAVRPGLTGLWQVRGRGHVLADEMAFMDICYALGRTWRTDLRVLWETVRVVVGGRGGT